jgi:PKD repeat protein
MNFTALRINNLTLSFLGADNYLSTFLADSNAVPLPLASNQPYTTEAFSVNVVGAVSKPVAVFKVAPENPQSNQTVVFDASSSYDAGGGTIKSYIWDFGDNTTVADNKSTAVHAYLRNGLYPVNLTIMNDNNLTGSTVVWLQVGSMPTANFTYSPIGVILPTDELTFNASKSTARNSTIVSYFWDFGDNSTITLNESIVTHRYSKRGVYNVNLTVEDNYGLLNWKAVEIQVGKPPNPLFTWTPTSPQVGDDVTFTSLATADTGVSIANYTWDFGEQLGAVPTNESVILHTYPTDGNWTVTLTVYDSDGLYSSYNQTLEVLGGDIETKPPDYTPQIIFGAILAIIIVALVVRRLRTKKEEALDI